MAGEIERVAVVGGGGLMGSGIAQVVAGAGVDVTLVELDERAVARGFERIERSLARIVKSGTITEAESEATQARISSSTSLEEALAASDHVIETVVEVFDAKAEVLRRADAVCRDEVVL